MNVKLANILIVSALVVGCGENTAPLKQADSMPAVELTSLDRNIICRATVAVVMGRPISIIKIDKNENQLVYVSYRRSSDGSVWKNRCKTSGNRVVWSTVDPNGENSGYGRWRDHLDDSVITFTLTENQVTIFEKYSDGSGSPESFPRGAK